MNFCFTWSAVVIALLCCSAGCSDRPKAYRAGGLVLFADGKPVQDGRIEVRFTEQPYTARGIIDREGRFRLTTFETDDGAIAGRHEVLVIQRFTADIDDMAAHHRHASQLRQVDRKYSSYATSGLEITIDPAGDNSSLKLVVD